MSSQNFSNNSRLNSDSSDAKRSPRGTDADSKLHRRSRSGCFTCRLRRKKCDESKPICRACKHLGVECEYKRPIWWAHPERRRTQKELIKDLIKNTKLAQEKQDKAEKQPLTTPAIQSSVNTPPSLCHSLPTNDAHSDYQPHTRAPSVDSNFSPQFDLQTPQDFFNSTPMMPPPQWTSMHTPYPHYAPFEVDIKTERQMFVNDMPAQKESVISTFTTFQTPPMLDSALMADASVENWVSQEYYESHAEQFIEEPLDFNFFDFPHTPLPPSQQTQIKVEEGDEYLLSHFLQNVTRLIFPVLDVNQHGSARDDIILPALESNPCYLHCCLSTAALHLKATTDTKSDQINNDIMRHRHATILELCEMFARDTEHSQILEATLGLILFQSSVGNPSEDLPDIPWHQHFQPATSLIVEKLNLLEPVANGHDGKSHFQAPFNMTLASWIDILGATMLGRVPSFAGSYREKIEAGVSSGLAELMGCDDRVMYLISEIACLESLKHNGQLDDLALCNHIASLGEQLSLTDSAPSELESVFSPTGAIRPRQLSKNITALFRIAARVYLCSLVPDFHHSQATISGLVESFSEALALIPSGPDGFDRSCVWPMLIVGSCSTENSSIRTAFLERCNQLGPTADLGSFGRVRDILKDVWLLNDKSRSAGEKGDVHWREVMHMKGWDFLLI